MDGRRFDTLARTLSTTGTRRGALATLLSGALGLLGLSQPAAGRKRRGGGGVTIAGPCGDGGAADNRCDRNRDCCTGICERRTPDKPKRCRCRSRGEQCTQTRNCCQGGGQGLVCCDGSCKAVECCNSAGCDTGETCTPDNGTCAVTCTGAPGDCSSGGPSCGCRNGFGGLDTSQFMCIELNDCTCVTDCADCLSGRLCDAGTGSAPCDPGEHRCCTTCGGA